MSRAAKALVVEQAGAEEQVRGRAEHRHRAAVRQRIRLAFRSRRFGGGGLAAAAAAMVIEVAAATAAVAAVDSRGGGGGGGFRGGGGGGMPPQVVGEGKGVVKFFNPQKGFGFIVRDDGGEDVFVHISAVEQAGLTDLADGQPLEFTLGGSRRANFGDEPSNRRRADGSRAQRRRRWRRRCRRDRRPAAAADR